MKKLLLLVSLLIFGMASVVAGEVSTRVCLADGNTPLEPIEVNLPIIKCPDIMVRTKLTIIIDSNIAEPWSGSLCDPQRHNKHAQRICRLPG